MNLDKYSIKNLSLLLIGDTDKKITPKKSGPDIIEIFNQCGFKDVYEYQNGGLPNQLSRKQYAEDRLNKINGTKNMKNLILTLVEENRYFDTDFQADDIAKEINKIIKYDNYKLEKVDDKYVVVGELITQENVEVELHFDDIQMQIVEEIKKAKYTIWVAVAWFTDKVLFDELIKKKDEGLNIQVIVSNDDTNTNYGPKYEEYFETYRIDNFGTFDDNIFHNKFCIIDLETVIHGSYNWTKRARYNKEDIEKIKSREVACKFADRFIELKLGK